MEKTYAELLQEVAITVTPNDAAFLGQLLKKWMDENLETVYHSNLLTHLNGKAGC